MMNNGDKNQGKDATENQVTNSTSATTKELKNTSNYTDAEYQLRIGDIYSINEQYEVAIDWYAMAEVSSSSSSSGSSSNNNNNIDNNKNHLMVLKFRIYSHRSNAFYKLRRYQDSYDDAVIATTLLSSSSTSTTPAENNNTFVSSSSSSSSLVSLLVKGETESCWKRYGMAAYELELYLQAMNGFTTAYQLYQLNQTNNHSDDEDEKNKNANNDTTNKFYEELIQKCQIEINKQQKHQQEEQKLEAERLRKLQEQERKNNDQHKDRNTKEESIAKTGATNDGTINSTSASRTTISTTNTKPQPLPPSSLSTSVSSSSSSPYYVVPKYQYYQNEKFMTIVILESHLNEQRLHVRFETKSIAVTITNQYRHPQQQQSSFAIICGTLYDDIDVEQSKVVYKIEKTLIKLKKSKSFEWYQLLSKDTTFTKNENLRKKALQQQKQGTTNETTTTVESNNAATTATTTTASASTTTGQNPTGTTSTTTATIPRPYSSKKDWNTIERTIELDEALEEKPVGDDAMSQLFQTIFKDADEDTRRAMIKSYQTSGGTVLSTNWNEVKDTDYETQRTAPKGMEWKTWDGTKLPMKDDD